MSITDELRDYAGHRIDVTRDPLLAIADRIDAEFTKAAYTDARAMLPEMAAYMNDEDLAECGLVRLPKDADGVPIHVGDKVQFRHDAPTLVTLMRIVKKRGDEPSWDFFGENGGCYGSGTLSELRHYHAPTTEDVLRELLDACDGQNDGFRASLVAEYAKRLQLREDA